VTVVDGASGQDQSVLIDAEPDHTIVADVQETMDRSGAPVDAETDALIEHLGATGTATGS
jgi:hypothetical protein